MTRKVLVHIHFRHNFSLLNIFALCWLNCSYRTRSSVRANCTQHYSYRAEGTGGAGEEATYKQYVTLWTLKSK